MTARRTATLFACLGLLTGVAACDGGSPEEKVADLLESAGEARDGGDLDTAAIKLKNALQVQPENAEARQRLGAVQLRRGDLESAVKEFRRAIEYGADGAGVKANLARALLASGQTEQVVELTDGAGDAALSDPAARALYGLRAEALAATGRLDAAEQLAERVVAAGETRAARLALARVAQANGDAPGALRHLDTALESSPQDGQALLMRARMRAETGNLDGALEDAQAARDATPGRGAADFAAIELALQADKRDQAWAVLDDLAAQYPDDLRVRYFQSLRALSEDRFQDARDHAETVLGNNANFLRAAFIAGAANLQLGNHETARNHLARFVDANPDSPRGRVLLAQAWRELGNDAEAQAVLQPIRQAGTQQAAAVGNGETLGEDPSGAELQAPDDRRQQVETVLRALRDQRYDEALETARTLQDDMPDSVVPVQLEAIVLWSRGDRDQAVARMQAAAEQAPSNADVALNLAKMHRAREETDAALKALQPALEAHGDNAALKVEAARAHARKGNSTRVQALLEGAVDADPDAIEARVFLARFHLLNGRPNAAIEVAEAAPDDQAANPALLEIAGRGQFARGNRETALETFEELAAVAPDRPEGHRWAGETLLALGRPAEAIPYLEDARTKADQSRATDLNLARALLRAGKGDRAGDLLAELAQTYPEDAEVALLEGNHALTYANDTKAAIAAFERALELETTDKRLLDLVQLLRRIDRSEDAIARLEDWRETHEASPQVTFTLAELKLQQGAYADAVGLYRGLVERAPENPTVRNNLAWALAQEGDLEAALTHARKAVELAPDEPRILDTLGTVLLGSGDAQAALKPLSKAANLTKRSDIQLNYAEALIAAGQRTEARQVLEQQVSITDLPDDLRGRAKDLEARLGE